MLQREASETATILNSRSARRVLVAVFLRWVASATIVGFGLTSADAVAQIEAGQAARPRTIAVVPFVNISGAPVDAWLGRGIAESVTADFARESDTVVLGVDRVLTAAKQAGLNSESGAAVLAISRALDTTYLVTGGYQRVGDRIRVTARLIAVNGTVVTNTVVDGAISELFELQDRLVHNLASGFPGRAGERIARSMPSRPPVDGGPAGERAVSAPPKGAALPRLPSTSAEHAGLAAPVTEPERGVASPGRAAGSGRMPSLVPEAPRPPTPPAVINRSESGGQATLRAVRLDQPIDLDGALDERVYQDVPAVTGFIQVEPNAGQPATEETQVWLFFDDTNVYIASRAWDSSSADPQWIANEMRRDGFAILRNDSISVAFDTFYDRRNTVQFMVTPIGGRMDGQVTNERNWNGDWNPLWEVKTGRFDGGWSFEARVPFRSLRYRPGRGQVWGVQLRRDVRWKNETSFINSLDQGLGRVGIFQASQFPTLVGLEAPESRSPLEIKPYAIGDVSSDLTGGSSVRNAAGRNFGLDLIKYGVTQNMTADFTVNTDFAQVEADEQQVNLTRFSLFFPEKREFFLENQGAFQFGTAGGFGQGTAEAPVLFYSRRIGLNKGHEVPIAGGGRLTGRAGAFTLGLLNIQTGDERTADAMSTNYSVFRVKRDVLRRSSVGTIFTNRSVSTGSPAPGSNQAYGVDATLAFYDNLSITSYWAQTKTTGITGNDTSYSGNLRYNGDRWGGSAEHLFIDQSFSPEVGFLRRDDMRKSFGSLRFSPRPRALESIRKLSWEGSYNYITDASGFVVTREARGLFGMELENSDRFDASYLQTYDFLKQPFEIAGGIVIPVGGYDFHTTQLDYTFGSQRRLAGRLGLEHGSFYGGTKTTLAIGGSGRGSFGGGRVEVTPQLSLEPGMSLNWVDLPGGDFTTTLVTTRATYTMTPLMFVSTLIQYNSDTNGLSTNLRLRWEYQPGSELFIVYNEQRDTLTPNKYPELENRAFIVKVNRLFSF